MEHGGDDVKLELDTRFVEAPDPNGPFVDPFDARQRAGAEVSSNEACATSPSCGLTAALIPEATYFLSVWSAPPSGENGDARFRYSASVRRFAPVTPSPTACASRRITGAPAS